MGIADQGCGCANCRDKLEKTLSQARGKWEQGCRDIVFEHYQYTCSDGCCDEYGVNVYINGFNLNCDGSDVEQVVRSLMEFLGVEDVNIKINYDYDL